MGLLAIAGAVVGGILAIAGVVFARRRCSTSWSGSALGSLVGFLGLAALFTFYALGALEGLLARMHVVGAANRGISAITGFGIGHDAVFVHDTLLRWSGWYAQAGTRFVAPPSVVLWVYVLIDSLVFVPAYVTTLALIRWRSVGIEGRDAPPGTKGSFQATLRRFWVPIAIAVADETENILTELFVRRPLHAAIGPPGSEPTTSGAGVFALRVATGAKWLLLALFVFQTIPSLVRRWKDAKPKLPELGRAIHRIRALSAPTVIFGFIVMLPLQTPDIIRRWNLVTGAMAAIGSVVLGLVAWTWARRVLDAERQKDRRPTAHHILAAFFVCVALTVWGGFGGPLGFAVPMVALFLVWWMNGLGEEPEPVVEAPPTVGRNALPKVLAIAPSILLGIGAIRATLPESIFNHPHNARPTIGVLSLYGVLPAVGGILLYRFLGRPKVAEFVIQHSARQRAVRVVALLLGAYVYWRVLAAVWSFSQGFGAVAIAASFMALLTAGAGAISLWIEHVAPPKAVAAFGFSRTPVFAFLLVWLLVLGRLPFLERQAFHDVRVDLAGIPGASAATLGEVELRWNARNPRPSPIAGKRQPVPMLFIAANGGGIKAATWASFALDCVLRGGDGVASATTKALCEQITPLGTDRIGSVFAASGVSGGSMGLSTYFAHEMQVGTTPDDGWIRRVLGDDFVSSSLAWQLLVESPRALLQFDGGMDRAEVLERAWERGWIDRSVGQRTLAALWGSDHQVVSPLQRGLMTSWLQHPELPLLLLNSAAIEDGCRFIVSPLATDGTGGAGLEGGRNCTSISRLDGELPPGQLFAASRDLRHFLCDGMDVRLSSAALMSARFPYVSPSGRLPFCTDQTTSVHLVDGGYLDNSGGASIAELWLATSGWVADQNSISSTSCIVPYLIIVDSGYGPTPDSKSNTVHELVVPPKGYFAAMDSRTIEGRNDAAIAFRRAVPGVGVTDRVATLYLHSQPGGEAPNGWTLDDTTINALEAQLASNSEGLQEIGSWFTAGTGC